MTAQIAKSDLAFELPKQTYINVRLEEPNLATSVADQPKPGLFGWIAQQLATFSEWSQARTQAEELRGMTERELADIGLNRGDLNRVFSQEHNRDLREARALLG